jgi:folate-binding protein YgfZ
VTGRAELEAGYRALRDGLGAFTLPRDVVRVEGPDAAGYLQGQLSQDLAALAVGASVDSLVLAPDGKIDALARVTRTGDEQFHLDLDGGHGHDLIARLARFKLRSRFELGAVDWTCIALRGPGAPDATAGHAPVVAAVDWNGWRGIDLLGPAADIAVPDGVVWCTPRAWESARIESGVPVMGREITSEVIPAEAGVVGRTVSFTKGCFTGQELVARIDSRNSNVPYHLSGLVLAGDLDPDTLSEAELVVSEKERPVGRVTSAAWCPGLGAVGALAYVHRSVAVPGAVSVVPAGAGRDAAVAARVEPLPLVSSA